MTKKGLLRLAFRYFRSRRMRLFEKAFRITPETRILDVGGSPLIWKFARVRPRVTVLNFPSALEHGPSGFQQVGADGCMLPFKDKSFDIVFSNSVIEHVGSEAAQRLFAVEAARVGRAYWIQTPNRCFPVEVHLMLPFIHFLPKRAQRAIISRFTIWQILVKPAPAERAFYIEHFLSDLRLLDRRDLQRLFPRALILKERFAGLTKSLIAVQK